MDFPARLCWLFRGVLKNRQIVDVKISKQVQVGRATANADSGSAKKQAYKPPKVGPGFGQLSWIWGG